MTLALNTRSLFLFALIFLALVVISFLLFTGIIHPGLHQFASAPHIMYGN